MSARLVKVKSKSMIAKTNSVEDGLESYAASSGRGESIKETQRGRPRADAITAMIKEGFSSPGDHKCPYCWRVFPRRRNLLAHIRTHTGERPYICDYPGCPRAFTQKVHLKIHLRRHTSEKPFKCSAPACEIRFRHANRHCTIHPETPLILKPDKSFFESELDVHFSKDKDLFHSVEIRSWLEKYRGERMRAIDKKQGITSLTKDLKNTESTKRFKDGIHDDISLGKEVAKNLRPRKKLSDAANSLEIMEDSIEKGIPKPGCSKDNEVKLKPKNRLSHGASKEVTKPEPVKKHGLKRVRGTCKHNGKDDSTLEVMKKITDTTTKDLKVPVKCYQTTTQKNRCLKSVKVDNDNFHNKLGRTYTNIHKFGSFNQTCPDVLIHAGQCVQSLEKKCASERIVPAKKNKFQGFEGINNDEIANNVCTMKRLLTGFDGVKVKFQELEYSDFLAALLLMELYKCSHSSQNT